MKQYQERSINAKTVARVRVLCARDERTESGEGRICEDGGMLQERKKGMPR